MKVQQHILRVPCLGRRLCRDQPSRCLQQSTAGPAAALAPLPCRHLHAAISRLSSAALQLSSAFLGVLKVVIADP